MTTDIDKPETPPAAGRRRLAPLPAGLFSATFATGLAVYALVVGWFVAACLVVVLPVMFDRRQREWQAFAVAAGQYAACSVITQAMGFDVWSLAYLAGAAGCGLVAVLFTPSVDKTPDSSEGTAHTD